MSSHTRFALLLSPMLSILLLGGCSSSGGKSAGEKGYQGFQRTKLSVAEAQAQVDKTLAAMDQFQYTVNLSNAFEQYKAAVRKLEELGDDAEWRAKSMKENADAYITNWEREMETIQDPAMKANLASRRDAVRANFAQVRAAADEAREAYTPFLRDHQEIVKALSINLSPAALPGVKPIMTRAHSEGQTLKAKLAGLRKQLDNIERGVAPGGGAPS